MTRVLFLSHSIPHFPGTGAPTREFCLARALARRHEISYLLPLYREEDRAKVEALAEFCQVRLFQPAAPSGDSLWRRLNWSFQRRVPVERLARKVVGPPLLVQALAGIFAPLCFELQAVDWEQFDLFQVEHPHLAHPVLDMDIPIPKVLDWIDVHSAMRQRQYQRAQSGISRLEAWWEWRRTARHESRVAARFEKSLAMSDLDATRLRELVPSLDVSIVPNGVDCAYFANPAPGEFEPETVVFTGTMDYEPNIEGVLFFCEQVLPLLLQDLPELRFYVVGMRPPPAIRQLQDRYPGTVVVTGFVEDVRPYLQRAAAVVVPLLNGGGTRLKILEAMAMQKAVVSTTVGCEGLDVGHGRELLVADAPEAFAQATLSLVQDPARRDQIAARGHALARQVYDWEQIATRLETAWLETVERHG